MTNIVLLVYRKSNRKRNANTGYTSNYIADDEIYITNLFMRFIFFILIAHAS